MDAQNETRIQTVYLRNKDRRRIPAVLMDNMPLSSIEWGHGNIGYLALFFRLQSRHSI